MTLGSFTVRLPLYRIESQVTYHSPRIPSVFERMIMRLCAQYRDVQQVCELSLLAVFRDRLGVGDARELIEISMSNLLALDALEVPPGAQALECPLSELRLTADGESFLRNDRLPGRPRTETVEHLYDPLTNETVGRGERPQRATRVQQGEASPLAELLRPPSPAAHVEMALTRESYPWKQPATEIERVDSRIAEEPHREQTIVLSCRDDSVLSVHAPYDAALQKWLEHADPEVVWDALLADILMTDDGGEPLADAALLRDVQRVQPLSDAAQKRPPVRLRIVSAGADITLEPATPAVVLSPEVDVPTFVDHAAAPPRLVVPLHLPLSPGFAGASLALGSLMPAVDMAGAFQLYWAGQPRRCGLALTLAQSPSDAIWAVLREALATACATSDDPRVALLAVLWRDPASVIDAWLAARAHRSFAELLTLGEACTTALALWLQGEEAIWKPLLNNVLVRRLGEAAARVLPGCVPHPEAIATLKRVKALLPVDGAALQTTYLMNASPMTSVDQLAALRAAMLPVAAIPGSLIAPEIQQLWVEQALDGAELALHGPHELVERFQSFREAASAVHRDIGEQALSAARKDSVDPRTLTPRALSALSRWRNARDMAVHAGESIRFRELDHGLETWSRLARHHLAEPDTARRMVVLDTSALLERPALLRSLRPRDVPVMAQRVLNELDGLKKHEDAGRASRARDAIRQIESANGIRYEAAHPHLLPSEWDAGEPDNDILSVAQYLRLSDVLLLSNDRNLRNKAKSLGLAAEDTTSYAAPAAAKATSTPTPARAKPNRR